VASQAIKKRKMWKRFLGLARRNEDKSNASTCLQPEDNNAQIEESLSYRLKQLGITQSDFAGICDVTPRTVSNWVHGRTEVNPTALVLLEILEAYPDVREEFIYVRKGRPRGKPFRSGNPFRFGDRRRTIYIAGSQIGRAVRK
jgi:transcriptional regulator with XRE-family HTH domain